MPKHYFETRASRFAADTLASGAEFDMLPFVSVEKIINIAAYKFVSLPELRSLRGRLLALCKSWELKGTILLSAEGINLFVAGARAKIDLLLAELRSLPGLEDLSPKVSETEHQPFTKMLVRIKKEIIAFGVEGIDPAQRTSPKLAARDLKRCSALSWRRSLSEMRRPSAMQISASCASWSAAVAKYGSLVATSGRFLV